MTSRACDKQRSLGTNLSCSCLTNGRLKSPALNRLNTLVVDYKNAEVESVYDPTKSEE
jgi:hypothetical protein